MRKNLSYPVLVFLLTVATITFVTTPVFAVPGDEEHKDEPQKQTIIKKEVEKEPVVEVTPKEEPLEEYEFDLFITPTPLIKGEAEFTVKVETKSGIPVSDAVINGTVEMSSDMEDHGNMTSDPVGITFAPGSKPGEYLAAVDFDSVGTWMATIEISYPDGQSDSFSTELDITYDGANPYFLYSIMVIILASILYAQILKKKSGKGGRANVHTAS